MDLKGVLTIMAAAVFVISLAGCNTFKGVAKDIDSGADATQKVIKDATSDE